MRVYLWDANDRLDEARYDGRDYVTEIANADYVPSLGALLVGIVGAGKEKRAVEALGLVTSTVRVSQGRRRIRIEPLLLMEAVPVSDLLARMDDKTRGRVDRVGWPSELRPTKLPPTAASAVLAALQEDAVVRAWFASLEDVKTVDPSRLHEMQESRDAIGLAVEIADLRSLDDRIFSRPSRDSVPGDVIGSVVRNAHLADNEEDLIPEDLRRFEKDTKTSLVAGHVAQFRGRDYELTVFNVNKKPLEVALGVDLVYWDTVRNIFTLVQYKRLDAENSESGEREWLYKSEAEIRRQLDLMVTPSSIAKSSVDWRMTSPYWFKFVRRDAARFRDTKLLKGFYVPADYLRLALDDGSLHTGPRSGFRIGYQNVKRLTRATFAELVRRGLIGTMSAQSADLVKIVGDLSSSGRSTIVAIKSRWEEPGTPGDPVDLSSILDAPAYHQDDGTPSFEELVQNEGINLDGNG